LGEALNGFIGAPGVIWLLASIDVYTPPSPPAAGFFDDEDDEHAESAPSAATAATAATRDLCRDMVLGLRSTVGDAVARTVGRVSRWGEARGPTHVSSMSLRK